MEEAFIPTLLLTFKLSAYTTIILLFISIPLASILAYRKFFFKPILETLVSMPLVLPPSVLGFYLLTVFSPNSFVGSLLNDCCSIRLVFSFEGLLIGSILFSLPFMMHPLQSGMEQISPSLIEAAYTLGKSKLQTLFYVILPNIKSSLITGIVLSFAHTIGEFGVVLMIGGNIPNQTRVASIAIYDEVEALNYDIAHQYAAVLFVITFAILLVVYTLNKSSLRKF